MLKKFKNKKVLIVIGSLLLLGVIFGIVDYVKIKNDIYPLFSFRVEDQDRNTETWWGLGYKIERILYIESYKPRNERKLKFGLWFYTKQINVSKKVEMVGNNKEEYIKKMLENETSLYNISIIAFNGSDTYVLANDGTTPKTTYHYKIGTNDIAFVKLMRNTTNLSLLNTTNTDKYAILYTRDGNLYRLTFDTLNLEEIDNSKVESDLHDMYVYKNTVVLIYHSLNLNNKIVCLYNANDFKKINIEEVKSYQINKINNSLYIVDLGDKERTIQLR